ncbi:hypothetical protein DPEC_G00286480 [Dallia pectoralis]|uniref:Uncharacterized protein n=1 Tax=Dallia pectoralis TaxID=75939 RepID=A0ACC2FJV7_DALPE|nr:hypothetical protein DPEC_G00286480 [Dallia pectoralis]
MSTVMASPGFDQRKKDFLECEKTKDKVEYLKQVSKTVSKHRYASVSLKKPESSEWKIGDQEVTSYSGDKETVEEWGIFYLTDAVKMEVLGAVENLPFPTECGQLVIMLCEDRKVYAYDGEEMHLVAKSLTDLFVSGLQYPGIKTYLRGDCFKDMSSEDWDKVKREGTDLKKLEMDHNMLLREVTPMLEKCLNIIKNVQSPGPDSSSELLIPETEPEPVMIH